MELPTLLFIIGLTNCVVESAKNQDTEVSIKEVSLLLPYTSSRSRLFYKLGAINGCFEWSTNNQELIELEPLYESASCDTGAGGNSGGSTALIGTPWGEPESKKCSTSVKVSVRSGFGSRDSTLIFAEDRASGRRLRCEVFVDKIASISIETTTRTMFKDASEILEVLAFDAEGNRFSTVMGVEFEWSVSAANTIQIVPFKDSSMDTDPVLLAMEREGLQSSLVLVQGIDTGRAQVTARLTETSYSSIDPSTVTISVLEPLQLFPSHLLYVIQGTQIQYLLQTEKRNQLETITMPNPQYVWDSTNKKVGIVEQNGLFMATEIGKTEIIVQHKNMTENRAHTIVHVVSPSYLALKIEPINLGPGPVSNWNLIESKNYTLTVELYDTAGHKIYNSDISYDVDISKSYFEPITYPGGRTGSDTFNVRAIKEGVTTVRASLSKIYDPKHGKLVPLLHPISVEQELTISPQISLLPPILYFPFIAGQPSTSVPLRARGGSGEYLWYTNNSSIVDVDAAGVVRTGANSGQCEVAVVDKKNPHNREKAKALVIPPTAIAFSPSPVEVEVGKAITLAAVLKSDRLAAGHHFDACNIPDLQWSVEDGTVFALQEPSAVPESQPRGMEGHIWTPRNPEHCSAKQVKALKEGLSLVHIDHHGMKAHNRVFAYRPLTLDPPEALVTLGSNVVVHHQGGPEPWYNDPKLFQRSVVAEHPDDVAITMLSPHSFSVTCLQHNEQTLTLRVGNRANAANPVPATPTAAFKFRCVPPASIQLSLNEDADKLTDLPTGAACSNSIVALNERKPSQSSDVPLYKVRNNRDLPFIAAVFDEAGRRFTNFSTLKFDWASKDEQLAKWTPSIIGSLATLGLFKREGRTRLESAVTGYNTEILKRAGVTKNIPTLDSKQLHSSVDLDLISNVKLVPSHSTLFLNEKNVLSLEALGGSGSFSFSSNNSKIAKLEPNKNVVLVKPIAPGYLKVDVTDVCLGGASEPAIVFISEIGHLEISSSELIQVGGSTPLHVNAFDSNGNPFDQSQYNYIDLTPHIDNPNVLGIKPTPEDPQTFTLRGLDAGVATLSLANTNPRTGNVAQSPTTQIQVFPPFKVSPQTLHLVPGGHFQLQWSGGAASRQDVSFKAENPSVASVDRSGEIIARGIGETVITAIANIVDTKTGKSQKIGEDTLTVYVKNMTGIRLHSTIDRLLVGDEAKIRVIGANGETPFTYGTVDLYFTWECLDDGYIVSLLPVYQSANTTIETEGSFGVRVLANAAGSTTVTAYAYSDNDRSRLLFKTPPFKFTVVDSIGIPTYSLLLPLNTVYLLPSVTNKEGIDISRLDCLTNINCDGVTVKDMKIITQDRIGTCYLSATRGGRGDTSSLVKVNTKPFSHLEVIPLNPITVVPMGGSITFGLYLRDDIGELFSSYAGVAFETEFSNAGIIAVHIEQNPNPTSNQPPVTLVAKALRAGIVTLRVYLKGMDHIDDYVKIFVGRFIEPDNLIVHVGAKIQFKLDTQQLSQRGYALPMGGERVWGTGNSTIMAVEPATGKATALQPGRTTINYLKNPSSQAIIQVAKIASIDLELANQVIVSTNEKYSYPLRFKTQTSQELTSHRSVQNNIDCTCFIKDTNVATAKCELSATDTTQFQCVVTPKSIPTSVVDRITLVIRVADRPSTYSLEKQFDLPFETSFNILGRNEVQLTSKSNSYNLNIESYHPLLVESSDSSLVTVTPLPATQSPSGTGLMYNYIITPAKNAQSFQDVPVYIRSSESKTKQSVLVSYNEHSSYVNQQSSLPYMTISGLGLAIVIALITFFFSFKYNHKPPTYVIPSQSRPIPASPFRSPPPPTSFQSPRGGSDSIYLSQSKYGRY
ncbi:nucleoporin 210 [Heterostelium album PN500]|uniref:Nucleoporin 210 n=1 Tax=Heterostelium pallidum (strain ATCC 26659 / Pp 5 / PN500) TaxID=670386 RepID=D3B3Q8_HETP5|nr:nucleoporin 210 [Heterostelium album PN500]EFA83956.1 nucleoporin 210 [Heterostelium album PN500]|eukprot:XP_020436073.1 nucleoporin 210 [Heterostelium album PN500]